MRGGRERRREGKIIGKKKTDGAGNLLVGGNGEQDLIGGVGMKKKKKKGLKNAPRGESLVVNLYAATGVKGIVRTKHGGRGGKTRGKKKERDLRGRNWLGGGGQWWAIHPGRGEEKQKGVLGKIKVFTKQ